MFTFIFILVEGSNNIMNLFNTCWLASFSSQWPSVHNKCKLTFSLLHDLFSFVINICIVNNSDENIQNKNNNKEDSQNEYWCDHCPNLYHIIIFNSIVISWWTEEVGIWVYHNHNVEPHAISEFDIWVNIWRMLEILYHLSSK